MAKRYKVFIGLSVAFVVATAVTIVMCDVVVTAKAKGKCYDSVSDIPCNNYGLLLGTSPITPRGEHNYYFDNRIKATAELYHSGKIKRIIASGGDYSRNGGCNELMAMRDSLIAYNIPDSVMLLDYNGTRTLSSILQAKNNYNIDSITIISQEYHNERALYLAQHYGIKGVAYNARTPKIRGKRLKNGLREYLARVKMFIDLIVG
jgi:putative transport-related membrane protein